ncbi:MAG: response regulator, partial [Candidatus Methylomirabilales bacterium]
KAVAFIRTLDRKANELVLRGHRGLSPEYVQATPTISRGEGGAGYVLQQKQSLYIPDVAADPRLDRWLQFMRGQWSYCCVPMLAKGEGIGTLSVASDHRDDFTPEDQRLIETIAAPIAVAVEKAYLFEDATEKAAKFKALGAVSRMLASAVERQETLQQIARAAVELLDAAGATVWAVAPLGETLTLEAEVGGTYAHLRTHTRLRIGEGIVGAIVAGRQPLILDEYTRDPRVKNRARAEVEGYRAFAGVPLLLGEQAVGVLTVYRRTPDPFRQADIEVLTAFAAHAAVAIEKARLYQEIKEHSRNLEEKIRERTQELEIANRHKSEFLATMSHELRTPLNAVIGFSELLQDGLTGPLTSKQDRYVGNIHQSGKHLLQLINDILDLSKVEAGKMEICWESIDLAEVLREVQSSLEPQVLEKDLTLRLVLDPALPRVYGDRKMLIQILYNLLSNAIKFTPNRGRVEVAARLVPSALEVRVADTGIGIPPEKVDEIFEPFRQVDRFLSRQYQGTGLGLALTKRLVELHGGRIWVESTPDKGSVFFFTVPAVQTPTKGDGTSEQPLVLVVEDDPNAAELLVRYLGEGGLRTAVASTGEEVVRLAITLQPRAICLDILLPTIDGWQILRQLKEHPLTCHIPVVVVSIVDDRPRGLALGAVECLTKPIDRKELVNLVERCLAARTGEYATVLVVDDEAPVREMVRVILESAGIHVLTAENGETGLVLARSRRLGAIVLDLMMPGLSGFEVLHALRADPATAEIPVLIYTAKLLTPSERTLLRGQVSRVLQKGQGRQELLREIRRLVDGTPVAAPTDPR